MNGTDTTAALPGNPPADATLRRARAQAAQAGEPLVDVLAQIAGCTAAQAVEGLAASFGLHAITAADMMRLVPAFDLVPLPKAIQRRCLMLRDAGGRPVAAIPDPFDTDLQAWLELQAGRAVEFRLASPADIHACLARHEEGTRTVENIAPAMSEAGRAGKTAAVLSFAGIAETLSPAIRLLDSTLYDALKAGASDIHLETSADGMDVKFRIDVVLDRAASVRDTALAEQVISRLKILAELDIAERRVPQDGSFRVEANGREIDLRVSVMPSIHGEDGVIRILDKRAMMAGSETLRLDALGFDEGSLAAMRDLASMPYGMLLVTGPTGSGKTTTLYAALSEMHNGRDKIITIEDPVEYQLPGILQIPVNEKKGLTFARGLRSILRHDPDKIMVGEIRDRETAEIAVQSALTGHLVLSTVHANNVFDVFGRFTHMGIDPYAFASALNGVWAQRLIRLNCPDCAAPYRPDEVECRRLELERPTLQSGVLMRGRGCGACRGTGYRGRKAIAEVLLLNDDLREMVVERQPVRRIKARASEDGTRSLRAAALDLALRGETTLAEVRRVTLHA